MPNFNLERRVFYIPGSHNFSNCSFSDFVRKNKRKMISVCSNSLISFLDDVSRKNKSRKACLPCSVFSSVEYESVSILLIDEISIHVNGESAPIHIFVSLSYLRNLRNYLKCLPTQRFFLEIDWGGIRPHLDHPTPIWNYLPHQIPQPF
jgi:hypothetical protein